MKGFWSVMSIKVLFVCHGNICRSVMAQYMFQDMVNMEGRGDDFIIDSAATSTEEIGNPIYPPARRLLVAHGTPIGDHRARQMTQADYEYFDYLLGMDDENIHYMLRIASGETGSFYGWTGTDRYRGDPDDLLQADPQHKIYKILEYAGKDDSISDPWYDGSFEKTYQDLILGLHAFLDHLYPPKKSAQ